MRQLVYISTARGMDGGELDLILDRSRVNNARDGITGLLFYDGHRFLQALEGREEAIERTYRRICADPRHRAPVTLSSRDVAAPEFGHWNMACHRFAGGASVVAIVDRFVAEVSDLSLKAQFESYARLRAA